MVTAVEAQAFETIGHILIFLFCIGGLVALFIGINIFDNKQQPATPVLAGATPAARHHDHAAPTHAADRTATEHADHTPDQAHVVR